MRAHTARCGLFQKVRVLDASDWYWLIEMNLYKLESESLRRFELGYWLKTDFLG
jgi:hypothetical protein